MPRDVSIGTPENVPINYELAGLGSRSVAAIIDIVFQGIILGVLGIFAWLLERYSGVKFLDLSGKWLAALIGVVIFAVIYGYSFYFEGFKDGQTPGKRTEGLRVVRDGGLPIDTTAAAIRNLVRLVDFLPFCYMVGAWVVFLSPHWKRLGDYAGGTIVVKERIGEAPSAETAPTTESSAPEGWLIRNASWITPEEYQTVKRFAERADELKPDIKEQLAKRIAEPLIKKLEIDISAQSNFRFSVFLVELQRRCQQERGYL